MERLIVDIESASKALELRSVLAELGFVTKVTLLHDVEALPHAPYESEAHLNAELNRRTAELECGAVRGVSLAELETGAKALYQRQA